MLVEVTSSPSVLSSFRRRAGGVLLELLLWGLLGGFVAIGDLRRVAAEIPLGREHSSTVPTFNAWTLGWNANSLGEGLQGYWHAPIFFPLPGTFTYSEAQPTMLLVAPLAWGRDSLALAYNVYLMLLFGWTGLMTRRLLVQLGFPSVIPWLGGFLMLLLPMVHQELGVIQLVSLGGPVSVLWAVHRWTENPTWGRTLVIGIWTAITYLACHHYGLFLSLLAPAFLALVYPRLGSFRNVLMLVSAGGVALSLVSPVIWAQFTWLETAAQPRSLDLIQGLSASPRGLFAPYMSRFPGIEFPGSIQVAPIQRVGSGSLLMVMALIGSVLGVWHRQRRHWTLFCLVLGVGAGFLSCGPTLRGEILAPYEWLLQWYPGLDKIRSPYRMAVLVQMVTVFLALETLLLLLTQVESRLSVSRFSRMFPAITVSLLTLFIAGQTWPRSPRLHPLPDVAAHQGWINWLRDHTEKSEAIVCLPYVTGRSIQDYQPTVDWMYLGLWHGRPLLNGYSGFFPEHSREAKTLMTQFPDETSVQLLKQWGIVHAVVHRDSAGRITDSLSLLSLVYEDQLSGVRIYELK